MTGSSTPRVKAARRHIGLVPGGGPPDMTSAVAYWHVPNIEHRLTQVTIEQFRGSRRSSDSLA